MSLQKKIITIVLALLFLNAYSQHKQNWIVEIDSLVNTKNPLNFNGVILITKNGKTLYSKAIGVTNSEKNVPLNFDDQFEIMSNTKQITSVLLLQQVEQGKVNLNAPIKKYLPELRQSWADSVTVHQLLNHTHGIVDLDKPLLFKPGTDFKYGNLSCILLGKIIENTSHKTYRQAATELFKKLKMKNTFCYTKNNNRRLVSGHLNKDNSNNIVKSSFITEENLPADGVVTIAKDLSIWNNNFHKNKILSPKMYTLMTTESVKAQHNVFGNNKVGYGYNIRIVENDTKYFGHTGLGDGFSSLNIYIPESDVSLIVLENQMSENSEMFYYFEILIKDIVLSSEISKPFNKNL